MQDYTVLPSPGAAGEAMLVLAGYAAGHMIKTQKRGCAMQPNLDNVKKKIQENRDLVSRITAKFPGYSGYVEKAETYDADRIVRGLLADRVGTFKAAVNEKSSDLARKEGAGAASGSGRPEPEDGDRHQEVPARGFRQGRGALKHEAFR